MIWLVAILVRGRYFTLGGRILSRHFAKSSWFAAHRCFSY